MGFINQTKTKVAVIVIAILLWQGCSESQADPEFRESNFLRADCFASNVSPDISSSMPDRGVVIGTIDGKAPKSLGLEGYWLQLTFDKNHKLTATVNYSVSVSEATAIVKKLSGYSFLVRKVDGDKVEPIGIFSPEDEFRLTGLKPDDLLEISFPAASPTLPAGTYSDKEASLPFSPTLGDSTTRSIWRFSDYNCSSCNSSFAVTLTKTPVAENDLVTSFVCNAIILSEFSTGGPLGR